MDDDTVQDFQDAFDIVNQKAAYVVREVEEIAFVLWRYDNHTSKKGRVYGLIQTLLVKKLRAKFVQLLCSVAERDRR